MDFPELEKLASSPDVKLMILCSPQNPVGRVWTEDELKKVSDICMRNEVIVLSDEIHADLIRQDMQFIPAAVAGNPQNTITFNAPSKSFNIPGLMASTVIFGNEDLKSAWKKEAYSKNGMSLPNPFGLTAGAAAYEKGEDWLNQVNAYIDENLKFIKRYIDSNIPSIKFDIPEGTYLAWLDFNGTQYSDDEALADLLYKKFGILVDPGNIFGESGKGFIRINAACPRSRLSDAFIEIKSLF